MAVTEVRDEVRQPEPAGRRKRIAGWLTTTDHKKIGLLYIGTAFTFFLIGGSLAEMIRTQLFNYNSKLFTFARYDQIFTMHALIMIFLFVMPVTVGIANYIMVLQIGAADMAFPRVNAFSYWLFLVGGLTLLSAFAFKPGQPGWTLYAPLSEHLTPGSTAGSGTDMIDMGLLILGMSSLLGSINFLVTIF